MIFVKLAVRDLKRSMVFFSSLGFEFDHLLTDETAACMVVSEHAFVMLVTEAKFTTLTNRPLCDTTKQTEGVFAFSCESRADVDKMVKNAIAAGGKHAMWATQHDFMYCWSFYDLDGHHWDVVWMDPRVLPGSLVFGEAP